MRSLQNNKPGAGWNQAQDDLLRQLVEDAVPPEVIADQLKRTVPEIRRIPPGWAALLSCRCPARI